MKHSAFGRIWGFVDSRAEVQINMTTIKATIKGRRLELDVPAEWPDGIEVEIHPLGRETNGAAGLPADREAWLRFIEQTAGSITDPTFERQPQGELEDRETLP